MSYAEAKEIALLRLELRAACQRGDRTTAGEVLARLASLAHIEGNDDELTAEIRRWTIKLEGSGAT